MKLNMAAAKKSVQQIWRISINTDAAYNTVPLTQLDNCIQILHVHDNHWPVIMTLGCDLQENKICYYDSSSVHRIIIYSRLMPEKPEIKVDVMKITKKI